MAVPTMVEIEANGLRFETLLAGPEDGETVILLHGYPQSAASWKETMEWLADRGYRAIAPNLRGYSPGANPPEASEYSMGHLVGDVLGIADAQGVERFHLVGHDWGGALAWAVAGAYPTRLLSLTVLSTPHIAALLEVLRHPTTQSVRSAYMRFFRVQRVPEAMLNFANLTPAGLGLRLTRLPRASWRRDRAQLQRVGGLHGPLNWYRGAVKGSSRPHLVGVPTMYVWGRRDPFFGRRAAELTATYVTGPYRFEEINAGHWIVDRNAGDLQRLLGQHLDAHRAVRQPQPAAPRRPATRKRAAKPKTDAPRGPKPRAKRAPKKPDSGS
jgi:pimeloyl-ACP methyl ester carboxylesterase